VTSRSGEARACDEDVSNPAWPDRVDLGVVGHYVDSVDVCARCGVQLVPEVERVEPDERAEPIESKDEVTAEIDPEPETVSVLRTTDASRIVLPARRGRRPGGGGRCASGHRRCSSTVRRSAGVQAGVAVRRPRRVERDPAWPESTERRSPARRGSVRHAVERDPGGRGGLALRRAWHVLLATLLARMGSHVYVTARYVQLFGAPPVWALPLFVLLWSTDVLWFVYVYRRRSMFGAERRWHWVERLAPWAIAPVERVGHG